MKNMKISLKLIVSFSLVVLLSVIIGLIGIFGMYQMNVADDGLYNGNYLPTVMAGNISQYIVEQRVLIRNFVVYDVNADADIFNSASQSLSANRNNLNAQLEEYKGTIVTTEDQQLFDEFVKVYTNEWSPAVDRIYEYGRNNQTDEAQVALTDAAPAAEKLNELTTQLQELNLNDGQDAVDGNTALFKTMTIIAVVILVFSAAVSMMLAFYVSGLISKPITVLTNFMNKAGETGDISLTQEDVENISQYSHRADEPGQCIASCAKFVKRLAEVAEALETVANGDLTVEFHLLTDRDVMGKSLEQMLNNLNNMFSEINSATAQVNVGSKQIADGAQSLAQGSTEQASAVEQLSASIAEIANKTKENADMALRAATLAGDIKENAEKGNMQMDQMMIAVKEINEASQSISKVIGVIDNIAFQTNILALNAAVEAARAGQHGKGFAVVAEEVRSLASKSAEAAKETGALIANSMEKAEMGARIADETATSLVEIVSGINESTKIVGDIADSSNAQATAINEINSGIDQVAQVVQQNSATAQESAAASQEMSGQASSLEELISQFKLKGAQQRLGSPARKQRHELPESSGFSEGAGLGMGKY